MIDLTPLEVRQKKGDFRRALRGYDPELVNDFLDLVADRMEELVRENLSLREAVESVQGEVATYREKEQALSEALMTAQKLREDARSNVVKESELIIREARVKADAVRDDVARQLIQEEEALRRIRARRAQLVESFRRLLDREMSELDVIEETLELGESPDARPPTTSPVAEAIQAESAAEPPPSEPPASEAPPSEASSTDAPVADTDMWGTPPELAEPADELPEETSPAESEAVDTDLWDAPPEPAAEEERTDTPAEKPKSTADEDAPLDEWLSTLLDEEE